MNPNGGTPTDTTPAPEQEVPKPAAPVMDVVPPHADPTPASATLTEPVSQPQPGIQDESGVVAAPADDSPENLIAEESQATHEEPAQKPAKKPKAAKNGTTTAIIATVVIILVLSAMAMFAYMQTNK